MRLLPRRWPRRILLAYLIVLAISLALVIAKPGAAPPREAAPPPRPGAPPRPGPGGDAVPAMAAGEDAGGDAAGAGGLGSRFFEAVLRLGLPLLDVYEPGQLWPFRRGEVWAGLRRMAAGWRAARPLSWLEAGMPALALAREMVDADPAAGEAAPAYVPAIPAAAGEPAPSRPVIAMGAPLVIVYSTHAHESFVPELVAAGAVPGVSPYSDDVNRNMVRVAEELARTLQEGFGIPVLHLRDLFDQNGLTGAYMESERGVREAMARYPTARVLIDVHRDSAPRESTTTVVGGKPVARVMLVVGMGNDHLPNPHWQRNQAFASLVARTADRLVEPDTLPPLAPGGAARRYPPFVRQMAGGGTDPWTYARNGRFNQHLSERAILVEIGGPGNTMAEELRAARLVARAVAEVLRGAGMDSGRQ